MKKYLIALLLIVSAIPAFAGPHHHRHHSHGYGHHHWNYTYPGRWIAPVIIGGVIGYTISQQSAPVIVQQQPVIIGSVVNCTEWKEVMQPNGVIVRERFCN